MQYAKWSAAARGGDPGCAKAEDFYSDPWAQNIFRNYLATVTARANSFTGIAYRCPFTYGLRTSNTLYLLAGDGSANLLIDPTQQ